MNSSQWRDVSEGLYGAHGGFELALAPAVAALVGWWLDRTLGTTPVLVLVFAVGGAIGAVLSVYYRYRFAMHEASERRRAAEADLAAITRDSSR